MPAYLEGNPTRLLCLKISNESLVAKEAERLIVANWRTGEVGVVDIESVSTP